MGLLFLEGGAGSPGGPRRPISGDTPGERAPSLSGDGVLPPFPEPLSRLACKRTLVSR